MIILQKVFHTLSRLVDMLNGLVSAVLADILTWEDKVVGGGHSQRNREVAVVDLLQREFPEVTDEPSPDLARGHVERRVIVVL